MKLFLRRAILQRAGSLRNVSLLFLLVFAAVGHAEEYCKNVYYPTADHKILICSREILPEQAIVLTKFHISETIRSYKQYLDIKGIEYDKTISDLHGSIIVLSSKELNDKSLFHRINIHDNALGRCFPDQKLIYITSDYLKKKNTIIMHELVHMINAKIDITDPVLDEELAYGFEKFYLETE